MLFQVSALFARSFVNLKLVEGGFGDDSARHLSALAGFAVLGILIWPVLKPRWPAVIAQFRRPGSWGKMLPACVALGLLFWLFQMLALLALVLPGSTDQGSLLYAPMPGYFLRCRNLTGLVLAIPVMAIVTPVFEELINKGLILKTLLPKGKIFATVISATLFAVLHVPGSIPFAFMFGIITAVQVRRYRTLWSVVITHGVFNLLVVISRFCIDGVWLPGRALWTAGITGQLITLSLSLTCGAGVWWLVARCDAGADCVKGRPGRH
jgi:membrane protease YdiL (CAAX protease family)